MTVGAAVLLGADGVWGVTAEVAALSAEFEPPALLAVTNERMVRPTSDAVRV